MGQRNYTIDAFRLLGALSVVGLHVPYGDMANPLVLSIRMWGRWAVPFFFLLSGYFFEQNYSKRGDTQFVKTIRNLISIFIVANILYLISYQFFGRDVKGDVATFHNLDNGVAGHLWFIGSMIFAYVLLMYILPKISAVYYLPILAVLIYGVVLCFDAYSRLFHLSVEHDLVRYIVSIPFILLGYYLSSIRFFDKYNNIYMYLGLAVAGIVAQAAEMIWLYKVSGYGPHGQEFVFSSGVFAIGMLGLAFSLKYNHDNIISSLGQKYSLLIYLYHPLINVMLFKLWKAKSFGGGFIFILNPIISFVACIVLFVIIDKISPKTIRVLNGG